jgi:DNA-directed RNA polymerase subunit RPC12/RpoP
MDILCPVCKFKGTISDDLIPEEGKRVSCPKCKAKIFIKKPVVSLTAGETSPQASSTMELVNYDKAILDDVVGPEVKVMHARCGSCGGDIKVPENKKVLLCPTCGTNIVRQVIDEQMEPGFIESFVEAISQSFGSVFKGWGRYLKRRSVRRAMGVIVVLGALYLLFYGLVRSKDSPDSPLNKNIDVTFNFPTSGAEMSSDSEGDGVLKNLVQIDITSSDKEEKDEVRIYQIVFKDGSTSDYFRYYRYDRGTVYITLPDSKGGSYELGYADSDIQSIKRIRKVPGNVKVYGVN